MAAAPWGDVASFGVTGVIVTAGGAWSATVTLNEPVAWLPASSVAVHETLVVPTLKMLPDAGVHRIDTLVSAMSVAVVTNATGAPDGLMASVNGTTGSVSTGGVVSTTETFALVVPSFPAASMALQVSVWPPSDSVTPLLTAMPATVHVGVRAPSTLSVAEAVK